ncbi:hypothetical protein [Alkalibacterium subtropicum]
MITDKLVRMDYWEEGIFEDRFTQIVVQRCSADVDFKVKVFENDKPIERI